MNFSLVNMSVDATVATLDFPFEYIEQNGNKIFENDFDFPTNLLMRRFALERFIQFAIPSII